MFGSPMMPQFGQMQQMPYLGQSFLQPQDDEEEKKRKQGGFNPLMMLSPMAGMMASHPKMGLAMLSPGIGIANLLGAFK